MEKFEEEPRCRFCCYGDVVGGYEDIIFQEMKNWVEDEKEAVLSAYEKELCEQEAIRLAEILVNDTIPTALEKITQQIFGVDNNY